MAQENQIAHGIAQATGNLEGLVLIPPPPGGGMQILAAVAENRPDDPAHIQTGNRVLSWSNHGGKTIDGAAGNRDVIIIVSNMGASDEVIPRYPQLPLTAEDRRILLEQGVREDFHQSDPHIMAMRYILNQDTSTCAVLSAEEITAEEFKESITTRMYNTKKDGIVLHYIGPGQKETGNWCFKDGFISFEEIIELYTRHFKTRILSIVSDCSYSGRWVKKAMTFMDGKGVGPCGHRAVAQGFLIKVYASCQENKIPTERVFSTQCITNDRENGNIIFKIHLRGSMMYHQDPSGVDFTGLRCHNMIRNECHTPAQSTWRDWDNGEQIYVLANLAEGLPGYRNVRVFMYIIQVNEVQDIERELENFRAYRAGPRVPGAIAPIAGHPVPGAIIAPIAGHPVPGAIAPIAVGVPNYPPREVVGRNLIVNYSFGHL